jgi:hypothetical protein
MVILIFYKTRGSISWLWQPLARLPEPGQPETEGSREPKAALNWYREAKAACGGGLKN